MPRIHIRMRITAIVHSIDWPPYSSNDIPVIGRFLPCDSIFKWKNQLSILKLFTWVNNGRGRHNLQAPHNESAVVIVPSPKRAAGETSNYSQYSCQTAQIRPKKIALHG